MPTTPAPTGATPTTTMRIRIVNAVGPIIKRALDGGRPATLGEIADACLDCLTVPPTEKMLKAGEDGYLDTPKAKDAMAGAWEAMVAAMIAESKP